MTIKERVVQDRLDGKTYGDITREYGIPKSTAQGWVAKWSSGDESIVTGYVNENLSKIKQKRTKEDVLVFLEELAPITVNNNRPSSVELATSNIAIVMNDMHFPMHCQKTIDVAFEVISELCPSQVILNGDTIDMLAISRYPKDIRHQYSLLDERIAYHKFLDTLISVAPVSTIFETHANHSGNGTEGRWFRYLSERLGELASLPELAESLSYENVFLGPYSSEVNHVDFVEIGPNLVVSHGDVVRKHGGYSARGVLDKFFQSMIVGHTHRLGMTAQRVPALGSRPENQIYVWENGCMCDLNPIYASAPNWQNGFSIVTYDDEGNFGVEQVLVQNGVANVAALGKTIKV